jgi:hypothetical protein
MTLSRRQFFTLAGAGTATAVLASPLKALYAREARGSAVRGGGYGPLVADPNKLLDLPQGFQYQAFSRTGEIMSDGNPVPDAHDGMAAFAGPNNTVILVRNQELRPTSSTQVVGSPKYDNLCRGGTTTLIVGPNRQLIKHYASLAGTYRNCAGGVTPWGSWISCEENTSTPASDTSVSKWHGYNFEVPANASGLVNPVPLIEMGRFNHEAVAIDPKTGIVYQTEDRGDGLFYRFIPKQPGNLNAGGVLQALVIKGKPAINRPKPLLHVRRWRWSGLLLTIPTRRMIVLHLKVAMLSNMACGIKVLPKEPHGLHAAKGYGTAMVNFTLLAPMGVALRLVRSGATSLAKHLKRAVPLNCLSNPTMPTFWMPLIILSWLLRAIYFYVKMARIRSM